MSSNRSRSNKVDVTGYDATSEHKKDPFKFMSKEDLFEKYEDLLSRHDFNYQNAGSPEDFVAGEERAQMLRKCQHHCFGLDPQRTIKLVKEYAPEGALQNL